MGGQATAWPVRYAGRAEPALITFSVKGVRLPNNPCSRQTSLSTGRDALDTRTKLLFSEWCLASRQRRLGDNSRATGMAMDRSLAGVVTDEMMALGATRNRGQRGTGNSRHGGFHSATRR